MDRIGKMDENKSIKCSVGTCMWADNGHGTNLKMKTEDKMDGCCE